MTRVAADRGGAAIVIAGAGRSFVAGADIGEFGKPSLPPTGIAVIAAIAAAHQPVVAAPAPVMVELAASGRQFGPPAG